MNKRKNIITRALVLAVACCCTFLSGTGLMANNTFMLFNESATVAPGASICIDVTTKNFTDIAALQYDVNYDAAVLQFDELNNLNAELGNLLYSENPTGTINVSWVETNAQGLSLTDGDLIYQMCFTAIGSAGSLSAVSYDATTTVEVISGAIVELPWALVNGVIDIGGSGVSTLSLDDACISTVSCLDFNGNIDITNSGGLAPYEYAWTGPNGFFSVDQNLAGLEQGIYNLTITDTNNDELTASMEVMENGGFLVVANITNTDCTQSNGAINISNVTGGVAPYTYAWSNGSTGPSVTNLPAEPFEVTITDDEGCTHTEIYDVGSDNNFSTEVEATIADPDCNGATGSIELDLTDPNGVGPWVFLWSTGEVTIDIFNLESGLYSVTITEGVTGCTEVFNYSVGDGAVVLSHNVSCDPNTELGELWVTNWNNDQLYTFEWSNGEVTTDPLISSIDDLSPGAYSVTVTGQDSGCSATLGPIDVDCTVTQSPNSCFSQNISSAEVDWSDNVCIDVTASGFTDIKSMQYALYWDDSQSLLFTGVQNFNLPFLSESSFQLVFGPSIELNVTWLDQNYNGVSVPDGTVLYQLCFTAMGLDDEVIEIKNTTTPYEVINGDNEPIAFNSTNGHVAINSSESPVEITDVCTTAPGCINTSTGSIDITIAGGTAPYTFVWTDELGSVVGTSEDLNGVTDQGQYDVLVTDANGGLASGFANILVNAPSIYGSYIDHVDCNGASTASINIVVQNGTEPYSFTWSNGAITQNVTDLSTGTYTVTVMDQEGCIDIKDYFVYEPGVIEIIEVENTCPSASGGDGALNVSVNGGSLGYAYEWSNGDDTQDISGLGEGAYDLTVTDQSGCSAMASFYLGDCVWPGDTDSNGVVNNFDLLNIGLAYGTNGPVRPNTTINWQGQNADNWVESTTNSMVNYKHIDTDGQGLVDDNDTLAIIQNWGDTHNFAGPISSGDLPDLPPSGNSVTVPFYIQPDTFVMNTTVGLPVILGDTNDAIDELYGIAFSIIFDPEVVVPNTEFIMFTESWIGSIDIDMIEVQKSFHSEGRLDVALTRIDGANMAGQGQIATFYITIEDDLVEPGFTGGFGEIQTDFGIENVRIITNIEEEVIVESGSSTSTILGFPTSLTDVNSDIDLQVFPNPVSDQLTIKSNEALIESVNLYDVTARLIASYEYNQIGEAILETKQLAEGTYFVKVQTDHGLVMRRVVVLKD